ncbi:Nucleotidyltransferase domain protein [Anoxybacillus sp. BCO1]|nr:Nucleotidyltransferase domain protein [Anoxybacillus sp. BCO1]
MTEQMEQIIVEMLKDAVSPYVIYLFGSAATGHVRPDSDIDIAFLSDKRSLDHYERFMLAQQSAERLQRDVDLIDLKQASTVFQAQIVSSGKVIYCADEQKSGVRMANSENVCEAKRRTSRNFAKHC